jgi:hypothetical protein
MHFQRFKWHRTDDTPEKKLAMQGLESAGTVLKAHPYASAAVVVGSTALLGPGIIVLPVLNLAGFSSGGVVAGL